MRLMIYNIRYGTGSGWRFHFPFPFSGYLKRTHKSFPDLIEFIKSVEPDIIGLLEVDTGSFRSKKENQAHQIADALKHYAVFESKYAEESIWKKLPLTNNQGNALLTNREIKAKKFHYFQKGIKRLMIELEFEHFTLFLVHLSVKLKHRHEQLAEVYNQVNSIQGPVIVAGDFNLLGGSEELDDFLENTGLINANSDGLPSHPSRYPKRELDFVLHSPEIRVNSFSMPKVRFSDHIPLICDLQFEEKSAD